MIDAVPHDWLLPKVSAVVHHGGAGTTAARLRAGKPTVVCPFLGDQPLWGRLAEQLGVSPKRIPQSRLSVDRLADAIRLETSDLEIQKRRSNWATRSFLKMVLLVPLKSLRP